jgi:hypothetical protein
VRKVSRVNTPADGQTFCADAFVVDLIYDYFEENRKRPPRPRGGKFGLCYLETPLGTLEIRIDTLLALMAPIGGKISGDEIEITDAIVEASVNALDRIPEYMSQDLFGILMEATAERYAMDHGLSFDWRPFQKKLLNPANDRFRITALRRLFEVWSTASLEMDAVRAAFYQIVSKRGSLQQPWKKFVNTHLRNKKKPGRPSNTDYDVLFKKRATNPKTETFGKLVRELTTAASVPPDVARNRLKAAAAYRRKKLSLGQIQEL